MNIYNRIKKSYLKLPSEEIELNFYRDLEEQNDILKVKQSGWELKNVKNQTDDICKAAVQQNGLAIQWVAAKTTQTHKFTHFRPPKVPQTAPPNDSNWGRGQGTPVYPIFIKNIFT